MDSTSPSHCPPFSTCLPAGLPACLPACLSPRPRAAVRVVVGACRHDAALLRARPLRHLGRVRRRLLPARRRRLPPGTPAQSPSSTHTQQGPPQPLSRERVVHRPPCLCAVYTNLASDFTCPPGLYRAAGGEAVRGPQSATTRRRRYDTCMYHRRCIRVVLLDVLMVHVAVDDARPEARGSRERRRRPSGGGGAGGTSNARGDSGAVNAALSSGRGGEGRHGVTHVTNEWLQTASSRKERLFFAGRVDLHRTSVPSIPEA